MTPPASRTQCGVPHALYIGGYLRIVAGNPSGLYLTFHDLQIVATQRVRNAQELSLLVRGRLASASLYAVGRSAKSVEMASRVDPCVD